MKKKLTRTSLLLRFAGRVIATFVILLILSLLAVQSAKVIGENLALSRELSATRADIAALRLRRDHQLREMRRLESPEGAIPEIHERLRLVGPREAIVFLSPAPSPQPSIAP